MKKKTALFICLITIAIVVYKLVDFKEYELSKYEIELVNYFNEVALKAEYGESSNRISKWTEPMKIFILKEKEFSFEVTIIKNTIKKINLLVKDDEFHIQLIDDPSKCNTVILLMEREKAESLFPSFFKSIDTEVYGLVETGFDLDTYEITDAKIFIEINQPKEIIRSTILEEITQSIGLMNDSGKYSNSIFYENKVDSIITVEYSKMDIEIIKMLYHPKMKSGLNNEKVEKVITHILKNK